MIFLSHFLNEKTPLYGGNIGISVKKKTSIERGDSANSKLLSFSNHSGTHIDFPNHFIDNGKVSNNYGSDFWFFYNPYLIEFKADFDQIINFDNNLISSIPSKTDFLIVKTGFFKIRDNKEYWNNNPGFHPEMADKLRNQCPNLKVLGMDFISLTSFQNRLLGREAHKMFLGKNDILLVEDMKVDELFKTPKKIFCFPLLVDNVDGAPVTVIAEL